MLAKHPAEAVSHRRSWASVFALTNCNNKSVNQFPPKRVLEPATRAVLTLQMQTFLPAKPQLDFWQ